MYTGYMGVLYKISEWIMRFTQVNILWIGFSLFGLLIFGFFPATAAMFAVVRKWVLGNEDVPIFKTFLTTYKKDFLKSNLVGFVLSIIGYILYLDLAYVKESTNDFMQFFLFPLSIIVLLFLLTILYIFPAFVHFELNTFQLFKDAFLIMTLNPFITILIVLEIAFLYLFLYWIPFLIPFFGGSILAFLLMWTCNLAFTKIGHLKKQQNNSASIK